MRILHRTMIVALVAGALTMLTGDHPRHVGATRMHIRGLFRDVSLDAGIRFQYDNDKSDAHRFIETTGGGCAFLDYDNDGLLDILAIQGGPAPGSATRQRPHHVLYRNRGDGTFEDVTAIAGLDKDTGYSQGVAAADYDNDGWTDLLITSYGGVTLYHNHFGHFEAVPGNGGLHEQGGPHWATSAAWIDYDRDGKLDLFICHYASWFPDIDRPCFDAEQRRIYCMPSTYAGDACALYHNNGNGTFTEVTSKAGLSNLQGRALGALAIDADGDGWPDLFVSNDMSPNWLLRNKHDGTFENIGVQAGVAYGPAGQPLSGMGVAAGDFRRLGMEDLFVVNFSGQPRSYFMNDGNGTFEWGSVWANLGDADQPFLAFSVEALDYDLDGNLDLVIGNGHINEAVDAARGSVQFRERQQLLHNRGAGRFDDDVASAGDLNVPRITRGLAVGDFDNDGRPDILVSGPGSPLTLFHNTGADGKHWIGFRLEGTRSNRDGLGTRVSLRAGGRLQTRVVRSGSSYCSHSDTRPLFGLGTSRAVDQMDVEWPSGLNQRFQSQAADRYYHVVEGGKCEAIRQIGVGIKK